MSIRSSKHSKRRLVVALSFVSTAVLALPGWVWADCCCLSESSVATKLEESSCCHKAEADKRSHHAGVPRWHEDCRCDAEVATWHATIPLRQLVPKADAVNLLACEGEVSASASGSTRIEKRLKLPDRGGPRRHVWLCSWLA